MRQSNELQSLSNEVEKAIENFELTLPEIEPIPEISSDLGIGNEDFSWLDDVLRIEN